MSLVVPTIQNPNHVKTNLQNVWFSNNSGFGMIPVFNDSVFLIIPVFGSPLYTLCWSLLKGDIFKSSLIFTSYLLVHLTRFWLHQLYNNSFLQTLANQRFKTCLENEPRVGTPICRYLHFCDWFCSVTFNVTMFMWQQCSCVWWWILNLAADFLCFVTGFNDTLKPFIPESLI